MSNELEMMKAMASLFRKKAAVMEALEGGMEKKGKNDHFDYKFMTASDIKRTVGRLFAKHGISLKMSGVGTENAISLVETKDFKTKEIRIKEVPILRVQFSICLCDIDTGAVEESFWFGEAGATDDKAASKAATSALKYYLISNLMIADKDEDKRDTDRDAGKRRPVPTEVPQAPVNAAPVWWNPVMKDLKAYFKLEDQQWDLFREAAKNALAEGVQVQTRMTEQQASLAIVELWTTILEAGKKERA